MFQDIHQHSRQEKLFIIFDEIQYLPKWEIHLKSLVDSYSTYQFIATGGKSRSKTLSIISLLIYLTLSFCAVIESTASG
jgi:predicted AAA+ superfamily ATPase